MRTGKSNTTLGFAALTTFGAAVLLSLPVIERYIAATWQWYKFAGYSNDGHINLSFSTGLLFSALVAATFIVAMMLNRVAKRRLASDVQTVSYWAMWLAAAVAVAYWLLGMSSLNVWRA